MRANNTANDIGDEYVIMDDAFKKEIGIDINTAIGVLIDEGISAEDMSEIANRFKDMITYEIERKKVPYEYRFLLLNVIFCTMFKRSAALHKRLENGRKSKGDV